MIDVFDEIFKNLGSEYIKEKELIASGNLYEAFSLLKDKKSKEAKLLEGIIYILYKKYKKAYDIFKFLISDNEQNIISESLLYEFLGLCCYERDQNLDAKRYFIESLNRNPDNFYSRYNLTNIYIKKKEYKKAYENLKILQEKKPDDEIIKNNIKEVQKRL
ncbi:MAG: hypothetical protein ACQERZ_04325 [Fusobacteriota bacterium]